MIRQNLYTVNHLVIDIHWDYFCLTVDNVALCVEMHMDKRSGLGFKLTNHGLYGTDFSTQTIWPVTFYFYLQLSHKALSAPLLRLELSFSHVFKVSTTQTVSVLSTNHVGLFSALSSNHKLGEISSMYPHVQ